MLPRIIFEYVVSVVTFSLIIVHKVKASIGDNSVVFTNCLSECIEDFCVAPKIATPHNKHNETGKQKNKRVRSLVTPKVDDFVPFEQRQPFYLRLLGWNCLEECKYECMWFTVDVFNQYNNEIPQFYGKWPFIRLLGLQEPMSVFASLLNLAANLFMLDKLNKSFKMYNRPSPFKKLWYMMSLVSINAWIWSTIFHAKDTAFTEMMDYFCAFGFILFQFNSFFIRICLTRRSGIYRLVMYAISILCFAYLIYHCHYLSSVRFDYGYNMQMNILFGSLNSLCWILWSLINYHYNHLEYVWRCAFSVIVFDLLMLFEIFDFSPWFWFIDSHAMWHLSTVIIPFYWYKFLIDDNHYLQLKFTYIKI